MDPKQRQQHAAYMRKRRKLERLREQAVGHFTEVPDAVVFRQGDRVLVFRWDESGESGGQWVREGVFSQ